MSLPSPVGLVAAIGIIIHVRSMGRASPAETTETNDGALMALLALMWRESAWDHPRQMGP